MEFPFDNWLTWERCETDTSVGGVLVGVTTAAPPLESGSGSEVLGSRPDYVVAHYALHVLFRGYYPCPPDSFL